MCVSVHEHLCTVIVFISLPFNVLLSEKHLIDYSTFVLWEVFLSAFHDDFYDVRSMNGKQNGQQ